MSGISCQTKDAFPLRLTPSQVGMRLLVGGFVPRLSTGDLKKDIRLGHEWLVRIVVCPDFGYDALKWHQHLWATDAGGYKWCRRSEEKWSRYVQAGMARPGWADAVRELEKENQHPT